MLGRARLVCRVSCVGVLECIRGYSERDYGILSHSSFWLLYSLGVGVFSIILYYFIFFPIKSIIILYINLSLFPARNLLY